MTERAARAQPVRSTERAARAQPVHSVDRALDLLEALGGGGATGISALAARTGLHASTAHRLLATLVRRGWVERDPRTRRYRLAPRGPEA